MERLTLSLVSERATIVSPFLTWRIRYALHRLQLHNPTLHLLVFRKQGREGLLHKACGGHSPKETVQVINLNLHPKVIDALVELSLYANPSFYHACCFFFERPTGGFDEDFSFDEDYGRDMPGKTAREALLALNEVEGVSEAVIEAYAQRYGP